MVNVGKCFEIRSRSAKSYRSGAHGQVIGANTKGADSAGSLTVTRPLLFP